MKTWTRCLFVVRCGSCGIEIPSGGAFLEIRLPELPTSKRRCPFCAGEPEPPAVPLSGGDTMKGPSKIPSCPDLAGRASAGTFTPVAVQARDWKLKQAGGE